VTTSAPEADARLPGPEPEPAGKGVFNSQNLLAAVCSIVLPGSGHLLKGRYKLGITWSVFSLDFYAFLVLFRVGTNSNLYVLTAIIAVINSCAAAWDCCLRDPQSSGRKWSFLVLIVLVSMVSANAACYWTAYLTGVRVFDIPSASMSPTLKEGDRVLIDMHYYHNHRPQNGDIVIIYHAYPGQLGIGANGIFLAKRLIGSAGDTIQVSNGKVIRNGVLLEEKYAVYDKAPLSGMDFLRNMQPRKILPSKMFLLGDNRDNSLDSRSPDAGDYDESELRGKFIRIIRLPWQTYPNEQTVSDSGK